MPPKKISRKVGFFPKKTLDHKQNFKRHFRIERDGSIIKSISLNVPDPRLREEIIFIHFLKTYVKTILQENIGINILERDKPWDFSLENSKNEKFHVEIISIAEDQQVFINNKREELIDEVSDLKSISLSRLRKLNNRIQTEEANTIIINAEKSMLPHNSEVKNPWFGDELRIFESVLPNSKTPLETLIQAAIVKKSNKPHIEKDRTFLIIDNRTSAYDIEDFHDAMEKLNHKILNNPFLAVWFYTGFYSDNDGSNAEWILSPIIAPQSILNKIEPYFEDLEITAGKSGILHLEF